jgi:DNA polymerase delta subunit 1
MQRTEHISIESNDLIFQSSSWYCADVDQDDDESVKQKEFMIKIFGVDDGGRSISLTVTGFKPYFYIRWEDAATASQVERRVLSSLQYAKKEQFKVSIVNKKDFWGFQNDSIHKFFKIECRNMMLMRQMINKIKEWNGVTLYESNIEPIIRFIHDHDLKPCGWIRVPRGKFKPNTDILISNCQCDLIVSQKNVFPHDKEDIASLIVASFDIECTSSHGDFPMALKSYKKLSAELYAEFIKLSDGNKVQQLQMIRKALEAAFGLESFGCITPVNVKQQRTHLSTDEIKIIVNRHIDDIRNILAKTVRVQVPKQNKFNSNSDPLRDVIQGKIRVQILPLATDKKTRTKDDTLRDLDLKMSYSFPRLVGDHIIQIGTTFHVYGQQKCFRKHILTLGTCSDIPDVEVIRCLTETELILKWSELIRKSDPDIITGYNILGFDFAYLRDRADELKCQEEFSKLGRIHRMQSCFKESNLSSSALGDNLLRYYDMEGRIVIDIMKVVQRDHKLDTYKLDNVAEMFLKERKHDISPADIFRLQNGDADDRKIVAAYCVQDCALCNRLMIKLEIIANNVGMANVCLVPLSYIFMRGQGIKIFSLIAKQCSIDGYVVPTRTPINIEMKEGFEGAIVLEPEVGMYINDVVTVMDYNSLYPSSIIAENLSHDTIILDKKYDNLDGIRYQNIVYDIYEGVGDEKVKIGERVCRYAQTKQGVIPRILQQLLKARKTTRKRIGYKKVTNTKDNTIITGDMQKDPDGNIVIITISGEDHHFEMDEHLMIQDAHDEFQKAVLDGLQLAYKVTANSLYGQMGAKTSPVYLKDIAACTTSVGRSMILKAKKFMENNYGARVVYGDTDSIFCVFRLEDEDGNTLKGREAIQKAMDISEKATTEYNRDLKPPQFLEPEKCFYPFCLIAKKKYVGKLYPQGQPDNGKMKSMGIVLRRRDNAPIVKHIYGGVIDTILDKCDVKQSIHFLSDCLNNLIDGKYSMEDLIVTKSLRATYSDPTRIAHKVLAERIGERDPGNKPQSSDRVKYIYIESHAKLQGDRIETPEFITKKHLDIDYRHYITNQIMNPICQLYAIVLEQLPGYKKKNWKQIESDIKKIKTDPKKVHDRVQAMREKEVEEILFTPLLHKLDHRIETRKKKQFINKFFTVK